MDSSNKNNVEIKTFVTIKWKNSKNNSKYLRRGGSETIYDYRHVNAIYNMLKEIYGENFRLVCITDDINKLNSEIIVFNINNEHIDFINQVSGRFFKLFLYSPDFSNFVKSDFIYIDLDVAILKDIWYHGSSDIAILKGSGADTEGRVRLRTRLVGFIKNLLKGRVTQAAKVLTTSQGLWCRYNSSYIFLRKGRCQDLWNNFSSDKAREILSQNEIVGTDQAWLHFRSDERFDCVGPSEGFYRAGELARRWRPPPPPETVRFVAFPGPPSSKPWHGKKQSPMRHVEIYRRYFDEDAVVE